MKPLVSICIPTYNRSRCLKQTLDSIVTQQEFLDGRVEVVINDNASTDDTEQVGRCYEKEFKGIHYFRNNENIRDRNFPTVVGRAKGKLRKLNNDTAVLEEGSLAYLCEMEQKYENSRPLLFFSNENYVKRTGKTDTVLAFNEFLSKISYWVTWISSFSLWEDDCANIYTDFKFCDLQLWQVGKICEIGSSDGIVAVCPPKLIHTITPKKKDISYGLYKVFYENYFKIIDSFVAQGSITENIRSELEKDLFLDFFPDWIIQWEMENSTFQYSSEEDLKKNVFEECKIKPYWNEFRRVYYRKKIITKVLEKLKWVAGNTPKS